MQVKVYAKLNLTLRVKARQGQFHEIDSMATSVDLCDVVEVTVRNDNEVHVTGVDGVKQEQNTAYRAARAFAEAFATRGVDVAIRKGIPFGGGLGGSSADAAAVLYCMCKLFGVDVDCEQVRSICEKIGSDITFMLRGGLGRLRGKGDDVVFSTLKRPLYFALTTFAQQMSSREVYEAFDKLATQGAIQQASSPFFNDLQQAARSISNYAEDYLSFAAGHGLNPVMTGSGSAYFVPFEGLAEAQNAVDLLNRNGFDTVLCQTEAKGIKVL